MSSFKCPHCGAPILDTLKGYITGCPHYPLTGSPAKAKETKNSRRKKGRRAKISRQIRKKLVVRIGIGDNFLCLKHSDKEVIPSVTGIEEASVFTYTTAAKKNAKRFGGKVEELKNVLYTHV